MRRRLTAALVLLIGLLVGAPTPARAATDVRWGTVSTGGYHACALRTDTTLWCWGYNLYGQLGIGAGGERVLPQQVGADGWTSVSAGGQHTCALRTGGSLWCWGYGLNGQVGFGGVGQRPVPTRVGAATGWTSVSSGDRHTCATRDDGTLWCWGSNGDGRLGTGDPTGRQRLEPTQVGTGRSWRGAAAGAYNSCALRLDDSLWCWGSNRYGQVGIGGSAARVLTPQPVAGAARWTAVAVGGLHACAARVGGSLWCWGDNVFGQLGVGASGGSLPTPTRVGTATDWALPAAASGHSCATRMDGSLWCWGDNELGQLGLGGYVNQPAPRRVLSPLPWAHASASPRSSCATRTTGSLWCWGDNGFGQLGLGNHTSRPLPAYVVLQP